MIIECPMHGTQPSHWWDKVVRYMGLHDALPSLISLPSPLPSLRNILITYQLNKKVKGEGRFTEKYNTELSDVFFIDHDRNKILDRQQVVHIRNLNIMFQISLRV